MKKTRKTRPLEDRFWEKVEIRDWQDCWLWQGSTGSDDHGQISIGGGVLVGAHRVVYEMLVGPIPDGLVIDHVVAWGCTTGLCVNPLHLEAVTQAENTRRGRNPSAINGRKTQCIRGHAFSPENTYVRPCGRRACRICKRAAARKRL